MEPTAAYSTKAFKYAQYRWDYAPQAIQSMFDVSCQAWRKAASVCGGTGPQRSGGQ